MPPRLGIVQVPVHPRHHEQRRSLRTLGDFLGLQFGQVGFILMPVILSAAVVTAWRGYRRREPVAILLATCVLVPFFSCMEVADPACRRYLADVPWPAGIAAAAINLTNAGDGWSPRMVRASYGWSIAAIATGIPLVVLVFLYSVAAPWNLIGKNDPLGGEGGYQVLADRALAEMKSTGATWIATTDYRTYAMLRWHLKDKVPVVQVN